MPTISRLLNLCNKTLLNSRVINRSSKVYSSTSFSKWTLTFSSRRRSYSSVLIEEPSALVKKLASNISQNKDQLVHEKKQVNASDEGKFVFNQVWQSIAESCGGKEKIWYSLFTTTTTTCLSNLTVNVHLYVYVYAGFPTKLSG